MRGTWVPNHVVVQLEPREAQALGGVLKEVVEDDEFPLNELEDETVDALIEVLAEP